jgi:DHA1 family bicyclomycin/chloramphenicol resistance-like MFS transporter
MNGVAPQVSRTEFIGLMAMLMSLLALAIDSMLPALSHIGASLNVQEPNANQLIIGFIFIGMALGFMLYGPLSDSYGRKKAIYLGVVIFLLGNLISIYANDLNTMLFGRVLQGFGAAACRVVTLAMIRDKYEGREMARIMSLIMVLFIIVPTLAPSVGQAILWFASWRAIFWFLLLFGLLATVWLHWRQPETLAEDKRLDFTLANVFAGIKETLSNPEARAYTLSAGILFGAFIGYLSSSQQLFQIEYGLGDSFALYFGGLALTIGISSFINSKLVMHFEMETLCIASLSIITCLSLVFFLYSSRVSGSPSIESVSVYLSLMFLCFGPLFGNFNAMAIRSLGHIAGVASSVVNSLQTIVSVAIGGYIGQQYNGTINPLILGFLLCSLTTLIIALYVRFALSNKVVIKGNNS